MQRRITWERIGMNTNSIRWGKKSWHSMLEYTLELHRRSIHRAKHPFPHEWEDMGPGYCYGPGFGHWDIVHQAIDMLPVDPNHTRNQIINNLAAQEADGLVPGVIWKRWLKFKWHRKVGHPPVWPFAVEDYVRETGDTSLIGECLPALIRQIGRFEKNRAAEPMGFYYTDILTRDWESGVDEGVRFDHTQTGPLACVDATAHVYALYEFAARWSDSSGCESSDYREKAQKLAAFMREELFCEETGFFHDIWSARDASLRRMAFEGIWPLVVGAATDEQATRVIDENLLNPERFFTTHPIATVGTTDPGFELRCWRGPAWNSMTMWAARGCLRYGRADAARAILEHALDDSVVQFERTGTIWEFYHPHGGPQESLQRKPQTTYNTPCRDYLGHNPLIAMAKMFDETDS
jgi:glycogen debranching enzyme